MPTHMFPNPPVSLRPSTTDASHPPTGADFVPPQTLDDRCPVTLCVSESPASYRAASLTRRVRIAETDIPHFVVRRGGLQRTITFGFLFIGALTTIYGVATDNASACAVGALYMSFATPWFRPWRGKTPKETTRRRAEQTVDIANGMLTVAGLKVAVAGVVFREQMDDAGDWDVQAVLPDGTSHTLASLLDAEEAVALVRILSE